MDKKITFVIVMVLALALLGLIATEREVEALTARVEDMEREINAKDELIQAFRAQNAAVSAVLGQAAETLEGISVDDRVLRVAEIIHEVNQLLSPNEVEEISMAIVNNSAGIDPLLLTAMAITESGCRPSARGGSGEYGLLQIMPETGRWIASELGYTDWQPSDMLDVQMNVEFAAYYLWAVTKDMGGDTWTGVLAYNAGPTGARQWMKKHSPSEHRYAARVMQTYQDLGGDGVGHD